MARAKPRLPRQYRRFVEREGIEPDLSLSHDGHVLVRINGVLCGKISPGKPEGLRGQKNIMAQMRRTHRRDVQ